RALAHLLVKPVATRQRAPTQLAGRKLRLILRLSCFASPFLVRPLWLFVRLALWFVTHRLHLPCVVIQSHPHYDAKPTHRPNRFVPSAPLARHWKRRRAHRAALWRPAPRTDPSCRRAHSPSCWPISSAPAPMSPPFPRTRRSIIYRTRSCRSARRSKITRGR